MSRVGGAQVGAVDELLEGYEASNRALAEQLSRQPSGALGFLGINQQSFSGSVSIRLASAVLGHQKDSADRVIASMT